MGIKQSIQASLQYRHPELFKTNSVNPIEYSTHAAAAAGFIKEINLATLKLARGSIVDKQALERLTTGDYHAELQTAVELMAEEIKHHEEAASKFKN